MYELIQDEIFTKTLLYIQELTAILIPGHILCTETGTIVAMENALSEPLLYFTPPQDPLLFKFALLTQPNAIMDLHGCIIICEGQATVLQKENEELSRR